MKVQK